ncbi:hypothetical protein BU15DRAFT_78783 [Melanogaster broomeanus]|nr:hypothetical protein BU15DRAFT_78783 [Melanogaster broomeanus]
MDGPSSPATTIRAIKETGRSVVDALFKYRARVKNASKSCGRLNEKVQFINALAILAERYVSRVPTSMAPYSFCMSWIDDKSPAALYKNELDKLMKNLSPKQNVGWMKSLKRQRPLKKSNSINAVIESFEWFIESLNLTVILKNALVIPYSQLGQISKAERLYPTGDALSAISRQVEHQRAGKRAELFCPIGDALNAIRSRQVERQRAGDELQKMYIWMDAINCTTEYETTLGQRQDETCKWLFDLERYSDWCCSRNAFLRLCGKPGSGKSVLTSTVIENLSKTETDGGVLAYFYCNFRVERSTHVFEVIRSLVTQLLVKSDKDWLPLFDDLVKRKSNCEPPPVDLKILYPLLLKALQLHNRTGPRHRCT